MFPLDSSTGPMPMCVGYVPVLCQVLPDGSMSYVPVEDNMCWQACHAAQWPQCPENQQQGPPCGYAPSSWSTSHYPASKVFAPRQEKKAMEGLGGSQKTTVILRNLPIECNRDMLMQLLDVEGFSGRYDFLHYPIDFHKRTGLGYAIVNMVNHNVAVDVRSHFEGFKSWPCPSDNICEVAWNTPHQGLMTHIERYRNSPLMHESVPETYRPILLENGIPQQFPPPTAQIRPPRIRHRKSGLPIKP
jgi:hypothetical protein